jgi:hypothetical protein
MKCLDSVILSEFFPIINSYNFCNALKMLYVIARILSVLFLPSRTLAESIREKYM